MKRFHRISITLGAVLLVVLIWRIGPSAVWKELCGFGWGLVPVLALEGVAEVFHTLGWRSCMSARHRSVPFRKLFAVKLAGYAVNNLTPTANVGGEVTKGALLAGFGDAPQAACGVILSKVSFVAAQLGLTAVGSILVFHGENTVPGLGEGMLLGGGLLALGLAAFLILQRKGLLGTLARRPALKKLGGKRFSDLMAGVASVDRELAAFHKERPWGMVRAMLWYLGGFACYICQVKIFLDLAAGGGDWIAAAGIWFLGSWFDLAGFAVPLRLGVQEGSRVIALVVLGYPAALGLAFSMVLRLIDFFWGGLGLACYAAIHRMDEGYGRHPKEEKESVPGSG